MSKKEPVEIKVRKTYTVEPEQVFESEVVSSGNGAVIKAFKRFIGKKCIVLIGGK